MSLYDSPNQQVVRADGSGAGIDQGGEAPPVEPEAEQAMPGTHAKLDELAAERGHEWSADDLTVAEKQEELAG